MKHLIKIALTLVFSTISVVDFCSSAWAGEGGVADAFSFSFDNDGNITGFSSASAIGKVSAGAMAINQEVNNVSINVSAGMGSGAPITIGQNLRVDLESQALTIDSLATVNSLDQQLNEAQANSIESSTTVNIGTGMGDHVVKFDGTNPNNTLVPNPTINP